MRQRFLAIAVMTVSFGACGGGPNGPGPTPQPGAPQISCSSPLTVENVLGTSRTITYAAPTTTAGATPVSASCSPSSGSDFPLGSTTVTCTATDAIGRHAACSFTVSLFHQPLAFTKYLSFGDSLTEGQNGRPSLTAFQNIVDTPNAYPTFLQEIFATRIPAQPITVVNAGLSGEKAVENETRLKNEIGRHRPEVLLLLEGINDLNAGAPPQAVVNALRDNIRKAKERGVQHVFVSTLLPVAPDVCGPPATACRALFTPGGNTTIAATNESIRAMVTANGAHLVDPYEQFLANRAAYIDVDGLHLRPEGYRALANFFWDRIVQVVPARQLFGH